MTKCILVLVLNPAVDHILTVETFTPFAKNLVNSENTYFGGKGINAAFVLGKLGADCQAAGFTSADHYSKYKDKLESVGVRTQFIPVRGKTRENIKIVDLSTGKDTEFNQSGFRVTESDLKGFFNQVEENLQRCGWMILNGSLPPGAPIDLYGQLIRLAHSAGVKTCLDASGDAMAIGAAAKPGILRGNLHELEELCGHSFQDFAQIGEEMIRLHETGIHYVVVSLGSRGVIGFDGNELLHANAPGLSPVSLTGAGDALTAALVHQISEVRSFPYALAFSTAVASASVLCEAPGDFRMEDAQDFQKIIHIGRLN
jgi:1-phosphofructokinase